MTVRVHKHRHRHRLTSVIPHPPILPSMLKRAVFNSTSVRPYRRQTKTNELSVEYLKRPRRAQRTDTTAHQGVGAQSAKRTHRQPGDVREGPSCTTGAKADSG